MNQRALNKSAWTADSIRGQYFGKQSASRSSQPIAQQRQNELTPSAKYVVREARKRLGQQFSSCTKSVAPDESDLLKLVELIENHEGEELSDKERTSVIASLSASLEHYDLLTPLIENPTVNDIIVSSYKDISIQVGRRNIKTDIQFADHSTYKSFVDNLLKRAGKACTAATPVVDAAVDSHVRVCVTHESFSPPGCGPMMTLRIARHRSISLDGLVQHELAPRVVLEYLSAIVKHGESTLLIAGEVGSGKTTLLKSLADQVVPHEAILIIEDTQEIVLNRPFVRTLLTREANTEGTGRISPAQAIRTGMRMAMNRVILGEMRDAEAAEAFIDVCASGHAGMSTIHARNARDALSRLELFLSRAQGQVDISTIRRQIANAVAVVVFLGVDKQQHKRRVMEVLEVCSSAEGIVQVSPIFSFSKNSNDIRWDRGSGISTFAELLNNNGVALPLPGISISLDPEDLYRNFHDDAA